MEPAIRVENISKKYLLKHEPGESYQTLRDSVVGGIKSLFTRPSHLLQQTSREEFWALKDVSFDIQPGDRVGIIGRNGAGKSTLLKVLSRIVSPTTGRVEINGRVASLLEVGTGFHPELSGRENIFLNGSILGMDRAEIKRKFDEIVAFAEVEKFLDTPVKRYSSGMYVRLAFAVAAHLEPEIMIVDEVLAVGDAAFQKKCLGKMNDISTGEGRTILFVSHNMEAVQKLCNKGILLQKGCILDQGSIEQVTQRYLEVFSEKEGIYNIPLPANHQEIPAYASRLQVENDKAVIIPEIPLGTPWQVRISFVLNKPVEQFVIALGVSTLYNTSLRTTWSEPENLKPGAYEAIFSNDQIILAEGSYKLVVGLSHLGKTIHYSDEAGFMNISEVSSLTGDKRIVNTKSGLLINQMPVSITQIV